MEEILELEHIQKYYGNQGNITKTINDISFSVNAGEFVSISFTVVGITFMTTVLWQIYGNAELNKCAAGTLYKIADMPGVTIDYSGRALTFRWLGHKL